jgi:hypothetical protein
MEGIMIMSERKPKLLAKMYVLEKGSDGKEIRTIKNIETPLEREVAQIIDSAMKTQFMQINSEEAWAEVRVLIRKTLADEILCGDIQSPNIVCDKSLNTMEVIDRNEVITEVYFSTDDPSKTFIISRVLKPGIFGKRYAECFGGTEELQRAEGTLEK